MFQSHAGSIEAVGRGGDPGPGHVRFNPTLVRLRLSIIPQHSNLLLWFQSHAGSIEAGRIHAMA